MPRTRERLPEQPFGREATRQMYSRYHSLRHKAMKAALPFEWEDFAAFFNFVVATYPEYHPDEWRFRFDLTKKDDFGDPVGYTADTFGVIKSRADMPKKTRPDGPLGESLCQAQAEICVKLLTQEGDLETLFAETRAALAA